MRTKVTKKWLEDHNISPAGLAYWVKQKKPDLFDFVRQCIKDGHCDWASWLMVRHMDRKQYLRYALYAVKQVEPIHRKKYPDSTVIDDVIKVVNECTRYDSAENRVDAADAAAAAISAADAAAAAVAAIAAAAYDATTGKEAYKAMFIKMLRYGMRIMKEKQ